MKITFVSEPQKADVLIPLFTGDDFGAAASFLKSNYLDDVLSEFKADKGAFQIVYESGRRYFLMGLGKKADFDSIYKTARQFSVKQKSQLKSQLNILSAHLKENADSVTEALLNGLITGTYQIGVWKSDEPEAHPFDSDDAEIFVVSASKDKKKMNTLAERATIIAESQIRVMDLVNTPGNVKTPAYIAQRAADAAEQFGFKTTIFSDEAIWENKLLALAAVNRGSEESAQFILLEYEPESVKNPVTVGLVGKGVTYDTGGLSIKPSASMSYMKSDMAGAAAVLGAFEAAVRLKLPVKLIAAIPVTDNLVDALSIKPGDIINSHSGKTIEVLDTDAEGRLILADGLSYLIQNFKPDHVIDMATLTGATVRMLGKHAGGLFSNNESLAAGLEEAGHESGEKLWRLPLWEQYADDLKSDTADVKNLSRSPVAGAIFAAKFLETFIHDHPSWAHLDIAGMCFGDTEFGKDKNSTGYGVRLIVQFLSALSRNKES